MTTPDVTQFATHDHVVKAFRVRAYEAAGFPHPDSVDDATAQFFNAQAIARGFLPHGIATPPPPGRCAHCGNDVPEGQHAAAHAVAGGESLAHPETGAPLRLLVNHCDGCVDSDHCSPTTPSPGSGHDVNPATGQPTGLPGGFCEPLGG